MSARTNADPFGTAALREGVLAAWRGSPTRLREDANAESDLALVGYAQRLLVELAQNAADAAQRAGQPGYLRVTIADGELRAANTGEPLDAAGVTALAALRASAKRDEHASVGRFGVGFAAVLGVTDAPRVVSTSGGVEFSAQRTAHALADDPPLLAELRRRGGRPPVLRLVWPTEDEAPPPPGFDTEVRLPLRAGTDPQALLAAFAEEAGDLLLALPWLRRIDIGAQELRREGHDPVLVHDGPQLRRWRVVYKAGLLPASALAGLGAEARAEWTLCWALPVDAEDVPQPLSGEVLHAPTPTAERLTLPARLIGTVPVDASRRHVHPGAAADLLLRTAAQAYPELADALAPLRRTALVPESGFPAGEIDATLREAVLEALRHARWLPAATGGELAPADAVVLDMPLPELAALLGEVTSNLLDAELAAARHVGALSALGVPRLRPAAIAELLAGLDRPPSWWRRCYHALVPLLDTDPMAREELGALPVPLADGRTVTGPRGVLVGDPGFGDGSVFGSGVLGAVNTELRLVHPQAAHPLLERLGACPVGPEELLDALRPAVERSVDDAEDGLDVAELAGAVLALAGRVGIRPWLGALALPDETGEPRRADELVLPGGALRSLLAAGAPLGVLDARVAAAHPAEALRAVGVLDSFAVLDDPHPDAPDHELDGEEQWWAQARGGTDDEPAALLAVRDLDLVDDECWPAALRTIAADPAGLAALRQPGGYTGWWLARHARLGGRPPPYWRLPGARVLEGLYDPVPVTDTDERLLAAAGVRTGLSLDGPADVADLLARLADPARAVSPAVVLAAHAALAAADLDLAQVQPPMRVRTVTGEVADADRVVVLDEPWLAAVLPAGEVVAGGDPVALAEVLDLPLASEQVHAVLLDPAAGRLVRWADLVEVVAVCAAAGLAVPEGSLRLHDQLRVRYDGAEHLVPFWVTRDGTVHAADPVRAVLLASGTLSG
ncbi:MAG TPA: ATP-binding protein [Pseudonocardiaceae bacterium]|nr:ATP-binding protein [Pseudonocardiaceae bacterium]